MADQSIPRRITQIGGSRLAKGLEPAEVGKKRQLAKDSPTRNFPINTDRLSFDVGRIGHDAKRPRLPSKTASSRNFHSFMELGQAGPAKIARDENHVLVALKAVKGAETASSENLRLFATDNVVGLIGTFESAGQTLLAYEFMNVSLRQIQGTSRGLQIQAFEIAAICKEVLNGLGFIHQELKIIHGSLNCGEIMLNHDGKVKIANIGISMIEKRRHDQSKELIDTRGLGSIMMELMETETWIGDPNTLILRRPEKWKDSHGIKSFLHDTATCHVERLKQHDFLPKESLQEICLKELVLVAQVSAIHDWDVYTKETIDNEA